MILRILVTNYQGLWIIKDPIHLHTFVFSTINAYFEDTLTFLKICNLT